METCHEKVCRKCGTINDERSLMCMRCGENLEMTDEKKYAVFKGRMLSAGLFTLLFIVLFVAYCYGMIFYICPWIYNKLFWFAEMYIFSFYKNVEILSIVFELIYTLVVFLINYIVVLIILFSFVGSKLIKKSKLNSTCLYMFCSMILSFVLMTIYKHKFDFLVIFEHLVSIIIVLPYIRRILLKRSI